MFSKHLFKLSELTPQQQTDGGSRIKANKENFPILQGMSLYKLILQPNGIREPHWHANANELGYCLKGKVLINLYHTADTIATFVVEKGDVFFIPSGALHHIENIGDTLAELVLNFSHENTEDFNLSSSLGAFSDAVLGNTWDVKKQVFTTLKRSLQDSFATLRQTPPVVPDHAYYNTPYKYKLESSEPLLIKEGGLARMARQNVWPIVRSQALYSLLLTGIGMREPHWHPETAELGFVKEGRGRMSILHPEGKLETYVMEEGDIYFIPKAYPHHIENLENTPLDVLVFFDQGMPRDIGFTASVRSYSNETLASITQNEPAFFAN
ncbi:MAG: cupin domain-containing protein, partial [Candidatus Obscuribacterales bacterium]|nr:cupin domain-containing protein [Candidatus Obscuribacterales bacterium]